LIEDVRMLGNIDTYFSDGAPGPGRYRTARGKTPYREIPYLFVGPPRPDAIGELAAHVFQSRYLGRKALRSPDLAFLHRLLGANSELFSYLFFDPEFIEALIAMGTRDARRWLDTDPGPQQPCQHEPLDAFVKQPQNALASHRRH